MCRRLFILDRPDTISRGLITIRLALLVGLMIAASGFGNATRGQTWLNVLHFKDGSALKGIVLEQRPGEFLTIEIENGNTFVVMMSHLDLITTEMVQFAPTTVEIGMVSQSAGMMQGLNPALLSEPSDVIRGSTKGFALSVHLVGSSISASIKESGIKRESEIEGGAGLGLGLSVGFSEIVAGFLRVDGSVINPAQFDEYLLVHADLGLRLTPGSPTSPTRFYLDGALSSRAAAETIRNDTVVTSGLGYSAGAGFLYFFSRVAALDFGLGFTFGRFSSLTVDGETFDLKDDLGIESSAVSSRFVIGFSIYPR